MEIKLSNIVDNFRSLREITKDCDIVASVKADAYGHGSVKVAWELIKEGVDYLCVATLTEAVELRQSGVRTPIVLLGLTPKGNAKDIIDLGMIPVISSWEDAALLQEIASISAPQKTIDVFIALETGMGRLGFLYNDNSFHQITEIAKMQNINIKGLMSHLADADSVDSGYTLTQIENLHAFETTLTELGVAPSYCTLANSAGIIKYPSSHFEAVRPGISLYGIYPSPECRSLIELKPAMSVKADIVYLKSVSSGFSVSYGMKYTTRRESLIGTLPLGYADGLPRLLSNNGRVIVNGVYAPIVGSICMDQCMIDVTDVPGVSEYNETVIMGEQGGLGITAEEIAERSGTIPYEVLTRFGQRLPKSYI